MVWCGMGRGGPDDVDIDGPEDVDIDDPEAPDINGPDSTVVDGPEDVSIDGPDDIGMDGPGGDLPNQGAFSCAVYTGLPPIPATAPISRLPASTALWYLLFARASCSQVSMRV